jgi:hypothetical protein
MKTTHVTTVVISQRSFHQGTLPSVSNMTIGRTTICTYGTTSARASSYTKCKKSLFFISDDMGKRKEQRVRGILPVKLSGVDASGVRFAALAHTVDLSANGVRIAGPLPDLPVAMKIWVHFHRQKACFEIVRFRRDSSMCEVGLSLCSAEGGINWGAEFEATFVDDYREPLKRRDRLCSELGLVPSGARSLHLRNYKLYCEEAYLVYFMASLIFYCSCCEQGLRSHRRRQDGTERLVKTRRSKEAIGTLSLLTG